VYILEVIPLIPLPPNSPQILSYFHDHQLIKGSVVQVPFGNRKIQAVVISASSVEESKITIKKTSFQLKKINQVISEDRWVSQIQLNLALWLTQHYYASLGASLKTVLPPFFGAKKYMSNIPLAILPEEHSLPIKIFEINARESIPLIKSQIKSRGQSLIILPERTILEHIAHELQNFNPTVLHSRISKSDFAKAWQAISSGETKLILGTRIALFAPFQNLSQIIIDDPTNEAYKSEMNPRYETYELAKKLAAIHGAQLSAITPFLSVGDFHIIQNNSAELKEKYYQNNAVRMVDMIEEMKTGNFSIFSRQLESMLINIFEQKLPILLYSARRAYTGTLICAHCGYVIRCKSCDIPMRVHKTSEMMVVCYHCSAYQSIPHHCPNCNSTNLQPAGVPGSQKIKEQLEILLIKHHHATRDIFIFDSDLINTPDEEEAVMQEINKSSAPIIIATQMILSYRYTKSFSLIGIPSLDALAANADFRTDERLLYQIQKLNDFNPETFIIQTYNPDYQAYQALLGNLDKFYQDELKARKLFSYPPFARLIKLEYRHSNQTKAAQTARAISEKIKLAAAQLRLESNFEMIGPHPAFIARENNKYVFNIILKIRPELKKLDTILKYVPSDWLIDVDPKSIV